jgi:hypothetical protein
MMTTRLISLLFAVPLAACTVGGAGGDDQPPGDDTPPDDTISGSIDSDRTLSGTIAMTGDTQIEAGRTLTLSAGTVLEVTTGKTLRVFGTLLVQGAAGSEVMMMPASGTWAGIVAEAGATVNVAYAESAMVANFVYSKGGSTVTLDHVTVTGAGLASQVEGAVTITRSNFEGGRGVNILSTGSLNASDTTFLGTTGDTIVQTGGVLVLDHIDVGNTSSTSDHCAMHINAGSDLTVSYSNIVDTTVGLMIGGTVGASFSYNNFSNLTNLEDISVEVLNSQGVFDHNYISGTPVAIEGITITNPEAAMIADAGPRP